MTRVMRTPRSVDVEITSRCNARCRYCYYFNNQGVTYDDLPTQRWLDFFAELGRAQVMYVCLSGGEPLLRDDIFELIDSIVRNRMRFQLLTNGRLVTRTIARRLRETGRCFAVQVSLDGATAAAHDSLRGAGSFAAALEAIRILHSQGLPVTVRTTIHPYNLDELPAIARLLLEDIGIESFSTNGISSLGTHQKYQEGLFLTPSQHLRAMTVLAALEERYPGRIQASAGPLANWHMFRAMEAALHSGSSLPGRGRLVGCGCIFSRIAVRSDGAYVPCVMLPQMVLGHIGRDTLIDVWQTSQALTALRDRRNLALDTFAECRSCPYMPLCTGNCPGTALSLTGDANRPSPEGCLRLFKQELASQGLSLDWRT